MVIPTRSTDYFRPANLLGVVRQRQTYLNLLYLLAAFPLGILYFVLLVTGISTGLGTAIVLVGLPVLVLTMLGWWLLARFERELTMWWLGVEIRPMAQPLPPGLPLMDRLRAYLRNPVTWKSLAYLMVKFFFGVLAFSVVTALISLTFRLLFAPLPYVVEVLTGGGLPPDRVLGLALSSLLIGLGLIVGFLTLHIVNALAWVWGKFATLTLGMSDAGMRIAQARALAERESARATRSEQSRRQLIVNASHELRTPIASIRGHVDSLLLAAEASPDGTPPEEQRDYLRIVARESERLSALVDDLLALARADAGELKLDVRAVSPAEVIEEVYTALAPLARRERQVTLVRDVPPVLPDVRADHARLAQVLLNLVRNAITYTAAGGIASISAVQVDSAHVAFIVADTGMGIPREELEHIWERFYRTDASRARASGGFGLGLSIVRDLVTAMGGTVSAESSPGAGSSFTVVLWIAGTPGAP
jgi:two-component system, OmpR family, phosphate regulon sensor histidine kinase PhoR